MLNSLQTSQSFAVMFPVTSFLQSFMKFDERNPKLFQYPPFFCFHGNCGKVCPTDSDFFGLSRSTRCGCCSYQVSSIFVNGCLQGVRHAAPYGDHFGFDYDVAN
jgi:hypothetical protein